MVVCNQVGELIRHRLKPVDGLEAIDGLQHLVQRLSGVRTAIQKNSTFEHYLNTPTILLLSGTIEYGGTIAPALTTTFLPMVTCSHMVELVPHHTRLTNLHVTTDRSTGADRGKIIYVGSDNIDVRVDVDVITERYGVQEGCEGSTTARPL